jgi:8-oxo-dGTP pyrophosphatase MutT (NUDIX family)
MTAESLSSKKSARNNRILEIFEYENFNINKCEYAEIKILYDISSYMNNNNKRTKVKNVVMYVIFPIKINDKNKLFLATVVLESYQFIYNINSPYYSMDREHCVSVPAGRVEKNEIPILAGFREFEEEHNNIIELDDIDPEMCFSCMNNHTKLFVIVLNKTPNFKYGDKTRNETVFSGFTLLSDYTEYEKEASLTLFPKKNLYCSVNIKNWHNLMNMPSQYGGCQCVCRNINCNFPQYSYKNGNISDSLMTFSRKSKKKCYCCLCTGVKFNYVFLPGRYKELYGNSTFYTSGISEKAINEARDKVKHIKIPSNNKSKWGRFKNRTIKNDNQSSENSPSVKQPIVKQPIVKQPIVKQPIVKQQIVKQPIVKQPIVKQPIVKQPIVKQPIVKQPIVKQPIVKQPIVKQPIVRRQIVKQQIVKQPIVKQPIVRRQIVKQQIVKHELNSNDTVEKLKETNNQIYIPPHRRVK